jgi:hypothetical protein
VGISSWYREEMPVQVDLRNLWSSLTTPTEAQIGPRSNVKPARPSPHILSITGDDGDR